MIVSSNDHEVQCTNKPRRVVNLKQQAKLSMLPTLPRMLFQVSFRLSSLRHAHDGTMAVQILGHFHPLRRLPMMMMLTSRLYSDLRQI
ncbi:hypothetical protein ARMSODRAFT_224855 [Armillaria solidipes]|uniref:Uncharacterized protein n=1 Tax=Armillaria solidipes TaxID=1076256 RepID=A0A2H3BZW9_9AGAR|nr:hypothetical protein ARMSODRAFT_224855 [Armillaria solidipes]